MPVLLWALMVAMLPASVSSQPTTDWLFPPFSVDAAAVRVGSPAPSLEWTTSDGARAGLAQFRGELLVLVFWASWCPWCRKLWPLLHDLGENHATRPRILPLNIWDERDTAEAYAARSDFIWPLLVAPDDTAERWHVQATPHIVVIEPDGRVAGVLSGFDPELAGLRTLLDHSRTTGASP